MNSFVKNILVSLAILSNMIFTKIKTMSSSTQNTLAVIVILSGGMVLAFLLILGAICVDILQYKRIGDTNFYLVEPDGFPWPQIYYSRPSDRGFYGLETEGFPYYIYWNDSIVIVKHSDSARKRLINYCIIKDLKTNDTINIDNDYELHEYQTKKEYEKAMDCLGLKESEMNQTDSSIPWSLHLWK